MIEAIFRYIEMVIVAGAVTYAGRAAHVPVAELTGYGLQIVASVRFFMVYGERVGRMRWGSGVARIVAVLAAFAIWTVSIVIVWNVLEAFRLAPHAP